MDEQTKKLDAIAKEIKAMRNTLHADLPALTKAALKTAEDIQRLSEAFAAMAEELKERLQDVPDTEGS